MAQPGNEWGDPTFCDDATLIDARLTERGLELYPVLAGLVLWGEKWFPNGRGARTELRDNRTGEPIAGVFALGQDGQRLGPRDVTPVAGPGADEGIRALIGHREQRR